METLLNTLFVMTQGAYLRLDHDTVIVEVEKEKRLQAPLLHLSGVTIFGDVMITPGLIHRLADEGKSLVFLSYNGRFKARIAGPVSGNVILRKMQYESAADTRRTQICRYIVAGKIQNMRQSVLRSARDALIKDSADKLHSTVASLEDTLRGLEKVDGVEEIRGMEGIAAREYFDTFDHMLRANREHFRFITRSRRPPRDRINALLSFLYTLLMGDCVSGLEGVGLDPQMGFLHALRPGRASLALDLMEEFRPIIADRLAITLINLQQITADDFENRPGGAVYLNEKGRKTVVTEYQKRKQDQLTHPYLERKAQLGLIPHLQARILARHLRGDIPDYIPFVPK